MGPGGPGGPIRAQSFQEYPDRYSRYPDGGGPGGARDPYGRKGGVDAGGQDEYQALRQRYDEEYWINEFFTKVKI